MGSQALGRGQYCWWRVRKAECPSLATFLPFFFFFFPPKPFSHHLDKHAKRSPKKIVEIGSAFRGRAQREQLLLVPVMFLRLPAEIFSICKD